MAGMRVRRSLASLGRWWHRGSIWAGKVARGSAVLTCEQARFDLDRMWQRSFYRATTNARRPLPSAICASSCLVFCCQSVEEAEVEVGDVIPWSTIFFDAVHFMLTVVRHAGDDLDVQLVRSSAIRAKEAGAASKSCAHLELLAIRS